MRVVDDSLLLWADTLLYNKDSRDLIAFSRVLVRDTVQKIWMSGDSLEHLPGAKTLTMIGESKLWQDDTSDLTQLLYVAADTLVFVNTTNQELIGKGSAVLVRDNITARSEKILYSTTTELLQLRELPQKQPIVWSDSLQLTADSTM